MIDYDKALLDPSAIFKHPSEVLADTDLSKQQKIKILEQWAYDAKEIETADSENMQGESASMLHRIMECLQQLNS